MIGGIIGTDVVRYDIYGPDVSIANKMESEGKKGHINVSERTKQLLEQAEPNTYRFEPHTKVESFDKVIQSYLVYLNKDKEGDDECPSSHLELPVC